MWTQEWPIIAPELMLLSMASLILILDQFIPRGSKWLAYLLSQVTLVVACCLSLQLLGTKTTSIFYNMFILDDIGSVLKIAIDVIGIFVLIYSQKYIFESQKFQGEYFVLCLFSIFGMHILISASSFLSLYLGIELLALPLYALITLIKEDKISPEASMKYFVMGALASGMLLYGISLFYGVTGSFELQEINNQLTMQSKTAPDTVLLFALVFVLVGLAFKFAAVPFHMWLPDVYQGAAMPVTLFIATVPKIAAFGFAIRLLIDTFPSFNSFWQPLIEVMAILSLILGNIAAIAQSNLKRMLAYSTIAHIGFVFLGFLVANDTGFAAAMNYILIYALMALGTFGIMSALSYQGFEAENIDDFKGLATTKPWIAFLMMLLMFSLAGVPPLAGFYAKFLILNALVQAGYIGLAVITVLLTVIGAFYYLRVIKVMYFDKPQEQIHFPSISNPGVAVLSINGLTLILLGIFPMPLLNLCLTVTSIPR